MKMSILLLDDHCPHCGKKIGLTTNISVEDIPPELPEPGSLSICDGCAGISIFEKDMRLRPPYEDEYQLAMSCPHIRRAILAIAFRNRRN